MQKPLSFALLIFVFASALFPAYYSPDDEALRQGPTFNDVYQQVHFGVAGPVYDISHDLAWRRACSFAAGPTDLHQQLASSLENRAPPV